MENLIRLLGDGRFHSGEELGAAMAISRAAVWKKLKTLSDYGLELDAVRGKGYRLPSGIELLNRESIYKELQGETAAQLALDLKMITASTNDDVRNIIDDSRWRVAIAEYQSQGRGRRGRVWQSPLGASLYYSMLWRIDGGLTSLDGLSLAVGLTVVKTLESLGVSPLGLKWPNDILANGKKLAGVLLEISGDPTGSCEVVIGIGINLSLSLDLKNKIDQPVTDVHALLGHPVSKNKLAGRLTENLVMMLETFGQHGFTPFQRAWQDYDAFAGSPVVLHAGNTTITGQAAGISESGAVLIRNEAGVTAYSGGEISLRKL
ncbi:bifunctional biotin--[acetyl-CoA-carboxylase] ligase/biotin operon repressor BirA [Parendozoicomonas haliclonae]|uniref:Bifunctional ligase/repressor BirA n=1 Tax=Parendozoicomonas haliclonae TaxID=1960125 RepID=A0A1X7AQR2_9GAMM|nr:bifunctional biotin--[acetyl-CoA-carboxylase] ligase/biotin operon repressor BirA [Parendozoicomonas haliclonae]SMA49747.1 Bifunctional ligase/repressor BirA [Parendozoicomonas haliclonae]